MENVSFGATSPDGMLQSYSEYLRNVHPENAKRFDLLRISDREAAIAEAVVFGILQGFKVDPQIHDQPNSGGPDFICCAYRGPLAPRRPEDRFVVEATSLDPDAVTDRSHIANEVPEDISGGAFGLVTRNICNKAKAKATQLSNYPMPRVLAIASSHAGVAALFNNATAMWALVSEPHWRHEIGSDTVDTAEYYRPSLFIKPGPDGTIIPCRQSISAILLVAVYGGQSEIWGILHPEAAQPFNYACLPDLPFVRIAEWPVRNGKILTEWVIADPQGYTAYQFPIQLPKPPRKSAAASK
jgi:hypothetical protein